MEDFEKQINKDSDLNDLQYDNRIEKEENIIVKILKLFLGMSVKKSKFSRSTLYVFVILLCIGLGTNNEIISNSSFCAFFGFLASVIVSSIIDIINFIKGEDSKKTFKVVFISFCLGFFISFLVFVLN